MHVRERVVLVLFAGVSILMVLLLGTPLGGQGALSPRNFCPLVGAIIGGALVLICTNRTSHQGEDEETWLKNERLAWNLIGLGLVAWAIGEAFWRYYRALGLNPFPSLADFGYSCYPPLVFAGLILLPSAQSTQKRRFLVLDSLISVGALLSIAWFLLLGSLAQTPSESIIAKLLGLYYPMTDAILLSCTLFLLLRGSNQSSARRLSLLVAGIGLFILTVSDFNFNIQSALGTYVEGTWTDLGWPLGIMTLGLSSYVRCFWPMKVRQKLDAGSRQLQFGAAQTIPYVLLVALFVMLVFNVLSHDPTQESIRVVLVVATMMVLAMVLARQILTMRENARLAQEQRKMIQKTEQTNQQIAEQNASLEAGITHLKDIQTRLANGDVRARAYIANGELWPLANGLNIMADRMMRSDRNQRDAQTLIRAISELTQALERMKNGSPLVIPVSCLQIPELHRLLLVLGLKTEAETTHFASPPQAGIPPLNTLPTTPSPFGSHRKSSMSSGKLGPASNS